MSDKFIALIPLRGGSKGIPNKNIKMIAGKPLCAWVIESAVGAESIEQVYVSTESAEIKRVVNEINQQFQDDKAKKNKLKIIDRPEALASDTASTEVVMLHFMENIEFDVLLTIQATSPMLSSDDLEQAIKQFKQQNLDSMLTAVEIKRFFWDYDAHAVNYDPCNRPRRQDFDGCLMENGAFYITTRELLKKENCRLGGNIGIYTMSDEAAVELDSPLDWSVMETILSKDKNFKI